jgi:hypothetical protein
MKNVIYHLHVSKTCFYHVLYTWFHIEHCITMAFGLHSSFFEFGIQHKTFKKQGIKESKDFSSFKNKVNYNLNLATQPTLLKR